MVNALATSRLDYCHSLLYGTVDKNFVRLQRLQNAAARLTMRMPKYSNITPVLKEPHWLPIRERVCFKIMLLIHRAVNCRGPVYLRDLICIYTSTRALRSAGTKQAANLETRVSQQLLRTFGTDYLYQSENCTTRTLLRVP